VSRGRREQITNSREQRTNSRKQITKSKEQKAENNKQKTILRGGFQKQPEGKKSLFPKFEFNPCFLFGIKKLTHTGKNAPVRHLFQK